MALNPDAAAFVPPGAATPSASHDTAARNASGGGGGGGSAAARSRSPRATPSYFHGTGPPWEAPPKPATASGVVEKFRQAEAAVIASLGPNPSLDAAIAALAAFDERLLRATVYAYENGFATCSPVAFTAAHLRKVDAARNAPQLARTAAELVALSSENNQANQPPLSSSEGLSPQQLAALKTAVETILHTASQADSVKFCGEEQQQQHHQQQQQIIDTLVAACDPLHADEIQPSDWELAVNVAASLLHLYTVAWLMAPSLRAVTYGQDGGNARCAIIATARLSALRNHVQLNRGAGCFIKAALPMLVVTAVIADAAPAEAPLALQLWGHGRAGAFSRCVLHFLSLPQIGSLIKVAEQSAAILWDARTDAVGALTNGGPEGVAAVEALSERSLGAVVLNEALAGAAAMLSLEMADERSTRTTLAAMAGVPTPMLYGGGWTQPQHHPHGAPHTQSQQPAPPTAAAASCKAKAPLKPTPSKAQTPPAATTVTPSAEGAATPDDKSASPMPESMLSSTRASPAEGADKAAPHSPPPPANVGAKAPAANVSVDPMPVHSAAEVRDLASSPPPNAAPTTDREVQRQPSPAPAQVKQQQAESQTTTGAGTAPQVDPQQSNGLQALLEETLQYDRGLMFAFALSAITECEGVTVATAKRAIEAVECACDGDTSLIEQSIQRRPKHPLRDYLAVCGATIDATQPLHRDYVRTATEHVLAREHGAAHATTLARGGGAVAGGGGSGVYPGGSRGGAGSSTGLGGINATAAARYTKKLPALGSRTDLRGGDGGDPRAGPADMRGGRMPPGGATPHHHHGPGDRGGRGGIHGFGAGPRGGGSYRGGRPGAGGGGGDVPDPATGGGGSWSVTGSSAPDPSW